MKMRFVLVDTGGFVSWAIKSATGSDWPHVAVVYQQGESEYYYESMSNKVYVTNCLGVTIRKNGVRGPLALQNLEEWVDREPKKRRIQYLPSDCWLPVSAEEAMRAHSILAEAAHRVRYPKAQILRNWLALRLNIHVQWGVGSSDKWTCSETCGRAVPPRARHYFTMGVIPMDQLVPAGVRLPSVESGVRNWMAAEARKEALT